MEEMDEGDIAIVEYGGNGSRVYISLYDNKDKSLLYQFVGSQLSFCKFYFYYERIDKFADETICHEEAT